MRLFRLSLLWLTHGNSHQAICKDTCFLICGQWELKTTDNDHSSTLISSSQRKIHIWEDGLDTNKLILSNQLALAMIVMLAAQFKLYNTYHMSWATYDGWEDSSWGVIATEASLDHSRAIVDHEGSYLIIFTRHVARLIRWTWQERRSVGDAFREVPNLTPSQGFYTHLWAISQNPCGQNYLKGQQQGYILKPVYLHSCFMYEASSRTNGNTWACIILRIVLL